MGHILTDGKVATDCDDRLKNLLLFLQIEEEFDGFVIGTILGNEKSDKGR